MPKVVSKKTAGYYTSGSAIRRMFEEGLKLKSLHGADNVCDLSIGNPQFDPPGVFLEALGKIASEKGPHAYMPNAGYPWVRERVAAHLKARGFFDTITADHIVMTTGAAGALNIVMEAILNPGEEVIILRPFFLEYRFYIEAHGGVIKFADTDSDFGLDVGAVESTIGERTRAIIVNSPNNPTGRVYPADSLEQLSAMLERVSAERGDPVYLISDEPYRDIIFADMPFVSPASTYRNSFMCYSWSKAFCVSGERIGYIAINPEMDVDSLELLAGSLAMCNRYLGFVNAPALMQRVIAEALDASIDVSHYEMRRDRLRVALDDGGYDYAEPEGAFYFFVRTPENEKEFIDRARRHLLLVVPGSDFGRTGYFRISYAAPLETIDLACEKLKAIAAEITKTGQAVLT